MEEETQQGMECRHGYGLAGLIAGGTIGLLTGIGCSLDIIAGADLQHETMLENVVNYAKVMVPVVSTHISFAGGIMGLVGYLAGAMSDTRPPKKNPTEKENPSNYAPGDY